MPTVNVNIDNFFARLGKKICNFFFSLITNDWTFVDLSVLAFKELEQVCFDFGIEVEEKEVAKKNKKTGKDEKVKEYAFEVGANRPDLLSVETLSLALGVFLGTRKTPTYSISTPA